MPYYDQREQRETVYHAGNGFYSPYIEPEWKKERRKIRGAGNGIGLASLGYLAFTFGIAVVFMLIFEVYGMITGVKIDFLENEIIFWSYTIFTSIVSLLVPFAIYALFVKIPVSVALPFRKMPADLAIGGILVGLGVTVIASYATEYLALVLETIGIGITAPEIEMPVSVAGKILYAAALTVIPAFVEEICFRGIVMQSLRRFGDIFALVASALIFGIFHLNLVQMPYAFIMGLCIGYFVMRTGSLWVGILIHFINNSMVVLLEFFVFDKSDEVQTAVNLVINIISVIVAIGAVVFLLRRYKDMFRFGKAPGVLSPGKKTVYFIFAPVLVVALIGAFIMTLEYVYII